MRFVQVLGFLFLSFSVNAQCIEQVLKEDFLEGDSPLANPKFPTSLIVDMKTGLVWSRCPIGFYFEPAENMCLTAFNLADGRPDMTKILHADRDKLAQAISNYNISIFPNDFRLPNSIEVQSILNTCSTTSETALNPEIFPPIATKDGVSPMPPLYIADSSGIYYDLTGNMVDYSTTFYYHYVVTEYELK